MSELMDLDAQLDAIDVSPKQVKLGGQTFNVRRDLTQVEVGNYFTLVNEQRDQEALAILVGAVDAPRLNDLVGALPRPRMVKAIQELMKVAGLIGDDAGE